VDFRRKHPAFEPSLPAPPRVPVASSDTPSMMARAARTPLARLLVMLAAATTGIAGVITATGAAVVSVVNAVAEANARRQNPEIDRRIEAVETRVNGGFGLPLEVETRQKKDEEIVKELDAVKIRLNKCESGTLVDAIQGRRR
jgi:hypothetical protein